MENEITKCEQAAAQLQAMERMVELADRLEKVVDQLIEVALTEINDQSPETHQDQRRRSAAASVSVVKVEDAFCLDCSTRQLAAARSNRIAVSMTRGEKNGWFVISAGAIALIASSCLAAETAMFVRRAATAQGTVIANREQRAINRGGVALSHVPTVEFTGPDGIARRIEPSLGLDDPIPVGGAVPVLYPPDAPQRARVGGPFLWTWSLGTACLGGFLLAFGGMLVFGSRRLVRWGVPMRR